MLLPGYRSVYSEWAVAAAFALILIVLRSWDSAFTTSTIGAVLGAFGVISYSLYLTHQFNLEASQIVASKLVLLGFWPELVIAVRLAFLCVVATLFWYFCERPFLNRPMANGARA